MLLQKSLALGLSPLARGNLQEAMADAPGFGTIPARAGEPCTRVVLVWPRRDYPRSRGGTIAVSCENGPQLGLSPLARGNLPDSKREYTTLGTIPARAGEPR